MGSRPQKPCKYRPAKARNPAADGGPARPSGRAGARPRSPAYGRTGEFMSAVISDAERARW